MLFASDGPFCPVSVFGKKVHLCHSRALWLIMLGPLPEATPSKSDRRIPSDSVGFGRILMGKFGRIWSE